MAELLREDSGLPKPQYEKEDGSGFEPLKGKNGAMFTYSKDGHNETLGSMSDNEAASGNGSLIALIKNLRTRLASLESTLSSGVSVNNFPSTQNVNVGNPVSVNDTTPIKVNLASAQQEATIRAAVFNADSGLNVNVLNNALPTLPFPNTDVTVANVTATQANTPTLVYDIATLMQEQKAPYEYIIKAMPTNTGKVFICSSQASPGVGIPLNPGEEFRIKLGSELYFSAENANNGIHVLIGAINMTTLGGSGPVISGPLAPGPA